jgi:hypothetical protein
MEVRLAQSPFSDWRNVMSWSEIYIQDRCRQISEPFRDRELERRRMLAEACAVPTGDRNAEGIESFQGRIGGHLLRAMGALVSRMQVGTMTQKGAER